MPTPPKRKGPTPRKATDEGAPPSRYTPPRLVKRIRPGWHLGAGIAELVVGILLVLGNYAEEFGTNLLPGGHQELYFLLGLLIAGGSMWWFGWFDRPKPFDG